MEGLFGARGIKAQLGRGSKKVQLVLMPLDFLTRVEGTFAFSKLEGTRDCVPSIVRAAPPL